MTISKQICLIIVVMIVGKACGYSENLIIDLVKFIIGFEIIVNIKFIAKKSKELKQFAINIFTKN